MLLPGQWAAKEKAADSSFSALKMLGESLPREMGDTSLTADMDDMNTTLEKKDDWSLLNLNESNEKKFITLMRIYAFLGLHLHYSKPSLFWSTSLRMVQLSLMNGYCETTPLAFAFYGEGLVTIGKFKLASRLGGLYFAFETITFLGFLSNSFSWLNCI